jgi:hypothetical protein
MTDREFLEFMPALKARLRTRLPPSAIAEVSIKKH